MVLVLYEAMLMSCKANFLCYKFVLILILAMFCSVSDIPVYGSGVVILCGHEINAVKVGSITAEKLIILVCFYNFQTLS